MSNGKRLNSSGIQFLTDTISLQSSSTLSGYLSDDEITDEPVFDNRNWIPIPNDSPVLTPRIDFDNSTEDIFRYNSRKRQKFKDYGSFFSVASLSYVNAKLFVNKCQNFNEKHRGIESMKEPLWPFYKERKNKSNCIQVNIGVDTKDLQIRINELTVEDKNCYPPEYGKTAFAAVIVLLNFIINLFCLAVIHESVPDRNTQKPLPDVVLSYTEELSEALDISEYLISISTMSTLFIIIGHKHRSIILRRFFLLMSILYLYRSITISATILPIASTKYYCSPKDYKRTTWTIIKRVASLMSGFGLSVYGKHVYCGDYIYSGHTVVLIISYLFVEEYTPKKCLPLHCLYKLNALVGIIMILLAHGHYTIDILVAYYVTTRLFWSYHTLTNNPQLKKKTECNLLSREWWMCALMYFEKNIEGPIPSKFNWPLPWPKKWAEREWP